MDPAVFDDIERTLAAEGAEAALDRLCLRLRQEKDYNSLFYALLMKKRHELGVSPVPTGPAQDLPQATHAAYEEAIRAAARLVGGLYLEEGIIPQAWAYFRMLNEPERVRQALEEHQPAEGEDVQALVQIAFYEGVHPRKGFEWVLSRFGLCSAITTLGSQELPHAPEVRRACLQALVRALYAELRERLTVEVERHDGKHPSEADAPDGVGGVVHRLIADRPWLFEDDCYHIDTSHLSSVVQMSIHLGPVPAGASDDREARVREWVEAGGPELELARELCEYGSHLSGRFLGSHDPPFEDYYRAHGIYLAVLAGDKVEEGLDYFRAQADKADPQEVGTYPAEVLVNLLLRLGRGPEALAVARKHLAGADGRQLTCPGISELCQKVRDYRTLAEVAREHGDPVHFLAGLLAART
jgi:hypothetical protein